LKYRELVAERDRALEDCAGLAASLATERARTVELERALAAAIERVQRYDALATLATRLESDNIKLRRELDQLRLIAVGLQQRVTQ